MIYITENAKKRILHLRESDNLDDSHFLRVKVTSGGCSGLTYKLEFDNEMMDFDQKFDHGDVSIVVDNKSFLYLFETTLDFSDGLNGKGFIFNNPQATRTCGCGESFSL